MNIPKRILPAIVFSQFAGTSLWFAGNAIIADLQPAMNVNISDTGIVTSAIQLGFITGTLLFALLSISDRYSPRKLFLICSLLGAISNLLIYFAAYDLFSLLVFRFITGFFLTGIYPIGMKIAAGWYKKGLGNAIGLLVGALVLGTAFPHLLKSIGGSLPWEQVIFFVSAISIVGGVLMYLLVPDGPYITSGTKFNPKAILTIFRYRDFRSAALGYFGHMWELYTFWAFVPIILIYYMNENGTELNIFFWSFCIIASGSVGCIIGGMISKKVGSAKVAFTQLLLSGMCCLISPLMFYSSPFIFLAFLIFWGIVVAGDSPQFSAIIALSAPKELVGSGLTLVNSIGFAITIFSLWFVYQFFGIVDKSFLLMILAIGPIAGLISMKPLFTNHAAINNLN
ncbi:MAG: MFS transporter [Ignavibacteriae bacterium]|nr:MAG: MFS transporter [Ignavibacteriota bacterium]